MLVPCVEFVSVLPVKVDHVSISIIENSLAQIRNGANILLADFRR